MTLEQLIFEMQAARLRSYDDWCRTRWLGTITANIGGVKKNPMQLLPLPYDRETELVVDFEPDPDRIELVKKAWGITFDK